MREKNGFHGNSQKQQGTVLNDKVRQVHTLRINRLTDNPKREPMEKQTWQKEYPSPKGKVSKFLDH